MSDELADRRAIGEEEEEEDLRSKDSDKGGEGKGKRKGKDENGDRKKEKRRKADDKEEEVTEDETLEQWENRISLLNESVMSIISDEIDRLESVSEISAFMECDRLYLPVTTAKKKAKKSESTGKEKRVDLDKLATYDLRLNPNLRGPPRFGSQGFQVLMDALIRNSPPTMSVGEWADSKWHHCTILCEERSALLEEEEEEEEEEDEDEEEKGEEDSDDEN